MSPTQDPDFRPDHTPARIAHVIDYSLDYLGGAQSAFLDEDRALVEYGHEVTLIAPGKATAGWVGSCAAQEVIVVAPSFTVPGVDLPYVRNTSGLRERLRRSFVERGIEVLHVHSEFGLAHAARAAARELGIPVVQTVHTVFWQTTLPRFVDRLAGPLVQRFLRRLTGVTPAPYPCQRRIDRALRGATCAMGRRVDTVISPSEHQAETLRAAGDVSRVVSVPNTVTVDRLPGEVLSEAAPPLSVLWVGRLVPEKRLMEFLDAVALAHSKCALTVSVVGDGPLKDRAKRFVAHHGLPVTFHGRLSRDEVHDAFASAHVLALTSYGFDNQPVVIVEALHARRPVLLCDTKLTEGLSEVGWYTRSQHPEAIAEALVELSQQPDWLVHASNRAADAAEVFQPDTHVAKLHAIYEAAMRRSG